MGRKRKPKQRVTEYYTSIQYAICHGTVDKLLSLKVNDKEIPVNADTGGQIIYINQPELFGGIKKEGGLVGRLAWQNGSDDQLLDSYVASKKGATPATLPGYRGIATAFFTEAAGQDAALPDVGVIVAQLLGGRGARLRGFYWSANQPIIPPTHFRVTRIDRSWRPEIAAINRVTESGVQSVSLLAAFPNITLGEPGYPSVGTNYPNSLTIGPFPRTRLVIAGPSGARADDRFVFNGQVFGDANFVTYPSETLFYILQAGQTLTVEILNTLNSNCGATGSLVAVEEGGVDMNPVHMIRECLVNSVWGLGLPDSALDMGMFEAAAEALFAEQFGLSMIWTQQAEIQEFVGEILSHIQATLYVNPMNGKLSLKLIRDDYDAATLDVLDPSNSTVTSFKRRSPAEITNEIAVSWTNPDTEKSEVVTLQSLGSIVANNGEIVSDNRNYYGVRRADLAVELAGRDLAASTAPLSSAEVDANRRFSTKVPGDVIKLTDPENGAFELIMRVLKVDYGRPGASTVQLTLTEDVFSFSRPRFIAPPVSENTSQSQFPTPPTSVEFITINRFFNQNSSDGLDDLVDPETQVAFFVVTDNSDTFDMVVLQEVSLPTGGTEYENAGDFSLTGRGLLAASFVAEVVSETPLPAPAAGDGPFVGGFVVIGPTGLPEANHEIGLITGVNNTTGNWIIKRGVLDTTPKDWAAGTPVRYFGESSRIVGTEQVTSGISANYRFLPRTSLGLLDESRSPIVAYTPTDRLYAPARPANVKVEGQAFGVINTRDLTTITVSWSNRNRLTEDAVLLRWDEASVTPEVGQTTTIRLINDATGSIITQYAGLTGTSHSFPKSVVGSVNLCGVLVISVRDGFESIQGHTILLDSGILLPNPVEYFLARNSSDQTLSVSTENELVLGSEIFDTYQVFSSNRFTVPAEIDGFYCIFTASFCRVDQLNQTDYVAVQRSTDGGATWITIAATGNNGTDGASCSIYVQLGGGEIYRGAVVIGAAAKTILVDLATHFGGIILEPVA